MTLAIELGVIVAPAAAVQTGQRGAYVFVVKPDSMVEARRVVVVRNQGNDAITRSSRRGSAVEVRRPPARGR